MSRSAGGRGYLLLILATLLAFNYMDRLALGLLIQEIKVELLLSDTEIGVLTGLAFAFFYSIMGLPIARWADRGDRVRIISIATLVWCAAVALCGAAQSFTQLVLIRIAAATGEAGLIPAAHSLIASTFDRSERPRAVSRFMMGAALSAVIGYFAAGWLDHYFGWRLTFMLLGGVGVILGLIAWATLDEPRRKGVAPTAGDRATEPAATAEGFFEVLQLAVGSASFRHLVICYSVYAFYVQGSAKWLPAFFIRSFGMKTGELGTAFAVAYGVVGLAGIVMGGEIATRFAAGNERLQLRAIAASTVACGAFSTMSFLSDHVQPALILFGLGLAFGATANAPMFATIQLLVPERLCATAIAVMYFLANLIGAGLGPLAVGALSDFYRSWAGEESLRYALVTMCPGYLWAAWHMWRASRTVGGDIAAVQSSQGKS